MYLYVYVCVCVCVCATGKFSKKDSMGQE